MWRGRGVGGRVNQEVPPDVSHQRSPPISNGAVQTRPLLLKLTLPTDSKAGGRDVCFNERRGDMGGHKTRMCISISSGGEMTRSMDHTVPSTYDGTRSVNM